MYTTEPKYELPMDVSARSRVYRARITDDETLEFARTLGKTGSGNPSSLSIPSWIMALLGSGAPAFEAKQKLSLWTFEHEDTLLLTPGRVPGADGEVTAYPTNSGSYTMRLAGAAGTWTFRATRL